MPTAIWAEMVKLYSSRLARISLLVACMLPILIGLAMSGLIGVNNSIDETPDGPAFLAQLGLVVAIGGLIGFGFVFSWIFGREFSDGTVKDLLALPVSRSKIVGAKFIVSALWCGLLAVLFFGFGCVMAWLVQLDGMSGQVAAEGFGKFVLLTAMVICLSIPVAWSASAGRGYLSSLGFVVLMIVIAQLCGVVGVESYFPWAVPGLVSGAAGEVDLYAASYALPFATGAIGLVITIAWWRLADHK